MLAHPATKVFVAVSTIALQFSLESKFILSASTVMKAIELQPSKHIIPTLSTDDGILIDVREEHFLKHPSPMLVTEDGMVMEVRAEHSAKQEFPRLVTEVGMLTEVREVHIPKQRSPRLVTEEGMSMDVREQQ